MSTALRFIKNGGPSTPGLIDVDGLTARLQITKPVLAAAAGIAKESVSRKDRLKQPKTQAELRDFLEILNRIEDWAGGIDRAFAWYRSEPLPSFGDRTAADLVAAGHAEAVKTYLNRIAAGGYA